MFGVALAALTCVGTVAAEQPDAVPRTHPAANSQGAGSVRDIAGAEALAEQGDRSAAAGDWAQACPRYEASAAVAPSAWRWVRVAECREHAGKLAQAWLAYREALARASASEVDAAERARLASERLSPLLPRLNIEALGNDFTRGLEIQRDGVPIAPSLYGVDVPVDPGEHRVRASAPGYETFRVTIELPATPGTFKVIVPPLEFRPPRSSPPATGPVVSPPGVSRRRAAAPAPTPLRPDQPAPGATQRTVGVALGAGGVLSLAVGVGFGIAALSGRDQTGCSPSACYTQADLERARSLTQKARTADVLFGVGLLSLASGVVVYWLSPSSASRQKSSTALQFSPALSANGGALLAWRRF